MKDQMEDICRLVRGRLPITQCYGHNFFKQVPPDLATEWINRMFKTAGDIIDITNYDLARDRFCITLVSIV